MMKRVSIVLATIAFAALLLPSTALANFAIHGNYVSDTDECAGCHRAHTSVSTLAWSDKTGTEHSALLVGSATRMDEFCYTCHDSQGQSADTNVSDGLYYGTLYGEQDAVLNGGGFESFDLTATTSKHIKDGSSWGAYGGGYAGAGTVGADGNPNLALDMLAGESNKIAMDCATCHDPHGSANYRILKAQVNGNTVGAYIANPANPKQPTPDGFVSSVETGWPSTGFELHTAYPAYTPNYTTPMYAKGYDQASGAPNSSKGMTGWCSGCHSTYSGNSNQVFTDANGGSYQSLASTYNAGDGQGMKLRHKHPVNVSLKEYDGPDGASAILTDHVLPVANDLTEKGTPSKSDSDWIECLTCHRAHGTISKMKGLAAKPATDSGIPDFIGDPSALLRLDNRGVCEACHNK